MLQTVEHYTTLKRTDPHLTPGQLAGIICRRLDSHDTAAAVAVQVFVRDMEDVCEVKDQGQ